MQSEKLKKILSENNISESIDDMPHDAERFA